MDRYPSGIELKEVSDSSIRAAPLLESEEAQVKPGCCKKTIPRFREISLSGSTNMPGPNNSVKNTKYNLLTFFPLFFFYQFTQPLNLFFLVIALTQFYPPLQVGFLFTYIAPLSIVMMITMGKESYDDLTRWQRDRMVNSQLYNLVTLKGKKKIPASDIKVGHIIEISAHERIPADMILLSTTDPTGSVFIKTDQLDGETDWKLRKAVGYTKDKENLPNIPGTVIVEHPHQNIYEFKGKFEISVSDDPIQEGLSLENTIWANTTLASGHCAGLVIYTGRETRSVMNSKKPSNKLGTTDLEMNKLAMYLLVLMCFVSIFTLSMSGFNSNSGVVFFRYLLLLSTIIPISLRVNLDFAKIYYCLTIAKDENAGNAKPRNSTIPEELGRIHVLLTDKTGTLTKNDMVLKQLSLECNNFKDEHGGNMSEFTALVHSSFRHEPIADSDGGTRKKRKDELQVRDMITALAVCHNVSTVQVDGETEYQASSPDEMCLVAFASRQNAKLSHRDPQLLVLDTPAGQENFAVLELFPFTSARKRMGIIVRHENTGKIILYLKGAETVMENMLYSETAANIMKEECENLSSEGLRTLAVAQRLLSEKQWESFKQKYEKAKSSFNNREEEVEMAIASIENNLDYLGVTGVEDKLQDNVDASIESLRAAGIKIWMLTGDKVETAQCIAISTRIKSKKHHWVKMVNLAEHEALDRLRRLQNSNDRGQIVIIDGNTLGAVLEKHRKDFVDGCLRCDAVVCCRASPTQKSEIVLAIKEQTEMRVCAIGDGGNDVGMIQSAHIGVGIEGKEGMQASLAADFSITEFQFVTALLLWHGRLSYLRTSKLANFVFHRGLIIAVIQLVFFFCFYYAAIPIYNGWLMLGYSTIYTSLPVFSLVLDRDSDYQTVKRNANLYQSLQLGRALNLLRFLVWIWKSVYQGSIIILLSLVLFPENSYTNLVAISFSALLLTELLNIATVIQTWNKGIVIAELLTLVIYGVSIYLLKNYFNLDMIITEEFFIKVFLITIASWLPMHILTTIKKWWFPDEGSKLRRDI